MSTPPNPDSTSNQQSASQTQIDVTSASSATHLVSHGKFHDKRPRITVIGVGGAGCNAVNNMIRSQLEGVEFVVMNTDAQALEQSLCDRRVHLGDELTQGLGAGSSPDIGRGAAEESHELISKEIRNSNMVFIAAGMGGGTGTGSTPVIARAARDLGILTVGVVTKPFNFEGAHRMRTAEKGIEELQKSVDTLIVIPNQNLFRVANADTTFADAFKMADDVLYAGVRSITDLMIMPGLINLDFADVRTVMSEMGKAMMGTGEAEGEGRAIAAAEAAIANPLLDDVSMRGATGVLISITGGMDMTLFEVDEAANRIREEVENDANIIFGSTFDDRLNGRVRVSVVATGIDLGGSGRRPKEKPQSSKESLSTHASESHHESALTPTFETSEPINAPQAPSRPVLNLTGDESEENHDDDRRTLHSSIYTNLNTNSDADDFMDATNDLETEPSDKQQDLLRPAAFEQPLFEPDYPTEAQLEETSKKPSSQQQMEIPFGKTASSKLGSSKDKSVLSTGSFLSRFLRGRNKSVSATGEKPHAEPLLKSNLPQQKSRSVAPKQPDPFDDELDIPTFMRKR